MAINFRKLWDDEPIDEPDNKVVSKPNRKPGTVNQAILVQPRAFSESQTIADHLKNERPVIVNMKRLTTEQAKRVVDFLSGTVYAIGGELRKVGSGIFLCTPSTMGVEGSIEDNGSKEQQDDGVGVGF